MTDSHSPSATRFPWRTAMALAVIVLIGGAVLFAYLKTLERAAAVAGRFATGRITQTFIEQIPEVTSTHGDVLEIATAKSAETFSRSDSRSVGWEAIYLGTTTSEIRVPVTYRYHIRLSEPWRLSVADGVCAVVAPRIRPSLPPAIHTDEMDKRTDAGWLRFNAQENLAVLEKSITPQVVERAGDRAHIALVREAARESVAEFVRKWLMREEQWGPGKFRMVTVRFADEVPVAGDSPRGM